MSEHDRKANEEAIQNKEIVIFWGSQSGVAERFAERLSRAWRSRFDLKTMVADLDDYDPKYLVQFPAGKLAVFLMSTYGEGDPTDNAVDFCHGLEQMRKKSTKLNSLRYLAMGLGNSNYQHYNQVIKVRFLH
jgi:NADPH-ferrihemoprotein reductase